MYEPPMKTKETPKVTAVRQSDGTYKDLPVQEVITAAAIAIYNTHDHCPISDEIEKALNSQTPVSTPCVIVDIDGTLSDRVHRLPFLEQKPKDWVNFLRDDLVIQDPLIEPVANLVHHLAEHYQIIYVTGRSARQQELTIRWLRKHKMWLHPFKLYCRPDGDKREDSIVKREILANLKRDGFVPVYAIDDRDSVVKMWREEGITTLQVASGDF